MRRGWLLLAVLAFGPGPALAQSSATFTPAEEDAAGFPDFPNRDLAFGFCRACHGFKIVAAQGMTREQWDGSLTWMTQKHNMPEVEKADRDQILDYLAKAFPQKAPAGGRPGWRNPFGPQ